MVQSLKTYQIIWADGRSELIVANSLSYSSDNSMSERIVEESTPIGMGHLKFWLNYSVILGAREADVRLVRLVGDDDGQGHQAQD